MSSYRHKSFVSSKKRKINCKTFDSAAKRRLRRRLLRHHLN